MERGQTDHPYTALTSSLQLVGNLTIISMSYYPLD
jgi:hypothetical protein